MRWRDCSRNPAAPIETDILAGPENGDQNDNLLPISRVTRKDFPAPRPIVFYALFRPPRKTELPVSVARDGSLVNGYQPQVCKSLVCKASRLQPPGHGRAACVR